MKIKSFVFIFLFCFTAQAQECLQTWGAVDFGSGTTKALAVSVNTCEKKIVKVLFEDRLPLALNESLEKSNDKSIPEETVEKALPSLKTLIEKLKSHQPHKIFGVATAVFRSAKNGASVAQRFSQELSLPLRVISQNEEAELGYWSVLATKGWDAQSSLVVWDIGGGSMQMISLVKGKQEIYRGDMASVAFKNKILEVLQFKNPREVSSPNPIGSQREAALQLAKNHAVLHVPEYFKKQGAKAAWVGVGGVLSMSVQRQVNKGKQEFTQEELDKTLKERALLRDEQLDGDYRISDVSNLALVLGYMQALHIPRVETVKASLGEGLIYKTLNLK